MKKLPLQPVLLWALITLGAAVTYIHAQSGCCEPPFMPLIVPRWPQGATVSVYIDPNSSFTVGEREAIKLGYEDWNGQQNNSAVSYHVITATPPPLGTPNTIVAYYVDENSIQGEPSGSTFSTSGMNTYGTVTFYKQMRTGALAFHLQFVRTLARHEAGHGLGLADALSCAIGSTIMHPAGDTYITQCDNDKIDTSFHYPCLWSGEEISSPWVGQCDIESSVCTDWQDNDCDGLRDSQDPGCICTTPIVIDSLGDGFNLTSLSDGVTFDITGVGLPVRVAWIQGDEAWLALDRNGNGTIDSGLELFGNVTPQTMPLDRSAANGFNALAEFDKPSSGGNSDNVISSGDAIFASLKLWRDDNHNGISELAELNSLPALGVAEIDLKYKTSKRADEHGNQFRYRAKVRGTDGAQLGRWAWDVFLVRAQ